jgi:MFS family permease
MASALPRGFNKLWAASAVSNLGDGVMGAAFPLLVASITRDPLLVAGATVVGRLPWFFFALVSGALVDRMDRKRVMVVVDWLRAGVVGVLGVLLLAGDVPLAVIYVVAFLLGSAETMFDTSAEAILPAIVGADALEAANGRIQSTEWATNSFAGPPAGAALFAAIAALPFLINAASFAVAAILVAAIGGTFRAEKEVDRSKGAIGREVREGLGWLWGHTVLRTLSIMAGVINLMAFGVIAIWVLYVQDEIGLGDLAFGLMLAAMGVGGLVGALTSAMVAKRLGQGTTLLVALVLFIATTLVMALTSTVALVFGAGFFIGLGLGAWNVVAISLRQSLTPDELRGRVAATSRMLAWGTQPLGALLGGIVAGIYGLRAPFFMAAAVWSVLLFAVAPIVNNRRIAAFKASAGA